MTVIQAKFPRKRTKLPRRKKQHAFMMVISLEAYEHLMEAAVGEGRLIPRILMESAEKGLGLPAGSLSEGQPK